MHQYYIYKYEKDREIIYIGKTINLYQRISQHKSEEKFKHIHDLCSISYIQVKNKAEMDGVEKILINQYKPKLNITDVYEHSCGFVSLNNLPWISFNIECERCVSDNKCRRVMHEHKTRLTKQEEYDIKNRVDAIKWIELHKDDVMHSAISGEFLEVPNEYIIEGILKSSIDFKTGHGFKIWEKAYKKPDGTCMVSFIKIMNDIIENIDGYFDVMKQQKMHPEFDVEPPKFVLDHMREKGLIYLYEN